MYTAFATAAAEPPAEFEPGAEAIALMSDPKTSGGLLIACDRTGVPAITALIEAAGHVASMIGSLGPKRKEHVVLVERNG